MAQSIPKEFINHLLEKVNIVDVINGYVKLEKKETIIGQDAHFTMRKRLLSV